MSRQRTLIRTEIELTHEEVSLLRGQLGLLGRHLRWPNALVEQIQLVFAEWATNLAEHSEQTAVPVLLQQTADRVELILSDGASFPATCDELPDLESESGRGRWLISQMTDQVIQDSGRTQFVWAHTQGYEGQRVLVVDDDPIVLALTQDYLSTDFNVVTAGSAEAAMKILNQHAIDLVVCDFDLPGSNGFELRRTLLLSRSTDLMPFVFISGDKDLDKKGASNTLAVDRFVQKPFLRHVIVDICHEAIKTQSLITRRLHEQFLKTSAQRTLIDTLPAHAPLQLETHHKTTGQGGGDFFLTRENENGRFFILGDCMGHDPSSQWYAHLWVGFLRGALIAQQQNQTLEPLAKMLVDAATNDPLLDEAMLTLCLVYQSNEAWMQVTSFGHPLPVLIAPDGQPAEVGEQYGMLGLGQIELSMLPKETWTAGMRMALFTDGVTEDPSEPPHGESGSALMDLMKSGQSAPLDELKTIIAHAHQDQEKDDATLIMLEAKCA